MDDLIELLETIRMDHVQRNALVRRIQSHFIEGDNIFVFDDEVRQKIAFDCDIVAKTRLPENAKGQGESHDSKNDRQKSLGAV